MSHSRIHSTLWATLCAAILVSVPSPANWPGFYIGGNLGGEFGHSKDKTGNLGYNADNQEWQYNESGVTGGAHFGYNYKLDSLVIGPEIDLGYLNLSGSGAQPNSPGNDTSGQSSSDLYTTIRARIGTDKGDWLFYATGGLIGVNYHKGMVDNCAVAPCGGSTLDAHSKSFNWGYTVGAGAEKTFDKEWSMKLEYLYFDLGSQNFGGATNLGSSYDWNATTAGHIIRAGMTYHFGESEVSEPKVEAERPSPPKIQPVVENKTDELASDLGKITEVERNETGLMVTLKGDVSFAAGKWELSAESKVVLEKVADVLLKNPDQKLLVHGYTDSTGKSSWNKLLSERRAKAVKAFFVQKGFAKESVTAKGFGVERAIASNETYEGRAKNRRVEIYIESNPEP